MNIQGRVLLVLDANILKQVNETARAEPRCMGPALAVWRSCLAIPSAYHGLCVPALAQAMY